MSVRLVVEILKQGDGALLVSAVEIGEGRESPVAPLERIEPPWDEITPLTSEVRRHLTTQRQGRGVLLRLERCCQLLFDALLGPRAKRLIRASAAPWLTLRLHQEVLELPWELLHDGRQFLCIRMAVGRVVRADEDPHGEPAPLPTGTLQQVLIADPRGDLPHAQLEGQALLELAAAFPDRLSVDLLPSPTRRRQVQDALRRYHAIHLAGHGEGGEWRLGDGNLSQGDLERMRGGPSFPALVFANACGSSGRWEPGAGAMARSFLLGGTRHFVGAICDLPDETGTLFATTFYRRLWAGAPVGEAVQAARALLLEDAQLPPLAWAGYVLYGEPGQVYLAAEAPDAHPVEPSPPRAPHFPPRPLPRPPQVRTLPLRARAGRVALFGALGLTLGAMSALDVAVVLPVLDSLWSSACHHVRGEERWSTPTVLLGVGRRVASPRPLYTALLDHLADQPGPPPAVVAFDTWFRDLEPGEALTPDDHALLRALARALGEFPVVIALKWESASSSIAPPPRWLTDGIQASVASPAHLSRLRWGSIAVERGGTALGLNLDLRIPYLRWEVDPPTLQIPFAHQVAFPLVGQDLLWRPGSLSAGVVGESLSVPLDSRGRMLLTFTGQVRWDDPTAVFSGFDLEKTLAGWERGDSALKPESLSGKIVLVGRDQADAEPNDADRRQTALGEMSGVEVQANAIEQLRQRRVPHRSAAMTTALPALVGAWASVRILRARWRVTMLAASALMIVGSYGLWARWQVVLTPVPGLLTLGLTAMTLAWWQDRRSHPS